jgi:small-conductance mechanosensitive channel
MELLGFTISTIWAVIVLIIWISLAFWPARVAARKGHSFFWFFILSLFSFLIALIVAYVISDKTVQTPSPTQQSVE